MDIQNNSEKAKAQINQWLASWRAEEQIAHIHGWDFSHLDGRYTEQDDLPWNYKQTILSHLQPDMSLLDIDTGGGEFLLSLGHPHEKTAATEGYPPNIDLCRKTLLPLGIDFKAANGNEYLPYANESFDLVINRHGDFNAQEIHRVLRPGVLFITQQVGAENDRELVRLLCGDTPLPFPEQHLRIVEQKFHEAGFDILTSNEHFGVIEFYDIGALTWFARIISWEFPGFSVDTHAENLLKAQAILEEKGCVTGRTHRFMLVAKKSGREGT